MFVFTEDGFEKSVSIFFGQSVRNLIKKNSLATVRGRKSIDIVRDVTNIAPILWLAERFALPLKTAEQPRGVLTIYETFTAYLALFFYQNFNLIPADEWKLREAATKAAEPLRKIFEVHLKTQQGITEHLVDWLAKGSAFEVGPRADRLYHDLRDTKLPVSQILSVFGV